MDFSEIDFSTRNAFTTHDSNPGHDLIEESDTYFESIVSELEFFEEIVFGRELTFKARRGYENGKNRITNVEIESNNQDIQAEIFYNAKGIEAFDSQDSRKADGIVTRNTSKYPYLGMEINFSGRKDNRKEREVLEEITEDLGRNDFQDMEIPLRDFEYILDQGTVEGMVLPDGHELSLPDIKEAYNVIVDEDYECIGEIQLKNREKSEENVVYDFGIDIRDERIPDLAQIYKITVRLEADNEERYFKELRRENRNDMSLLDFKVE